MQYRLQSEYGAESRLESAPWELHALARPTRRSSVAGRQTLPSGTKLAYDAEHRPVLLFPSEWAMAYFQKQNPNVDLSDVPFAPVPVQLV